jgi:hypothetical protein
LTARCRTGGARLPYKGEKPMKFRIAFAMTASMTASATALAAAASICSGAFGPACAQTGDSNLQTSAGSETPTPALTPAQRRVIYAAVGKDKSKTANKPFPAAVGADVPPMLKLYALPDQVLAENRSANFYEYTLVQDKVVLVDPTRMRVVDVIGPAPQ